MESVPFARDLTQEEEERVMEKISEEVVKRRLETMAIMFLESVKPLSFIGSQLAITFVGPFLGLFNNLGVDYIMFFNKHENVEKLLKKIEEKVKVKDEEEKRAKDDSKTVSKTYGIKVQLPPGFVHSSESSEGGKEKGVIVLGRTVADDPARGVIKFEPCTAEPSSLCDLLIGYVSCQEVTKAAVLEGLSLQESHRDSRIKIAGHKAFLLRQTWNDQSGKNGILESYGLWCGKSKRYFILMVRSGAVKGNKTDKDTMRNLRSVFGGFKCH